MAKHRKVTRSDSVDTYRRDNRSVEKFKEDIASGTEAEKKIMRRYARYIDEHFGIPVTIKHNGCDNSGKYLKDDEVSAAADFRINGRLIEVKFNNDMLDTFHFKTSQLRSYKRQRAVIIWVNGWKSGKPVFTILKHRHLRRIESEAEVVNFKSWGGKSAYRLHAKDYKWYRF